ncbi:MAG: exodeoxyribonuclease VII small subunit [Deltaproteobacteria bacterium]|nr:exodeoxyribonuclease VII small subunit [Deltaproteobacteria bacterium]
MAKKNFEDAMAKLEKIVSELEGGDLSLDKALKKFEEGIELTNFCSRLLDDTEKKIEVLTKSPDGSIKSAPFASIPAGMPKGEIGPENGSA